MIDKLIGLYDEDPTEWNSENVICVLCEKEAEFDDCYCEDHQNCK